MQLRRLACVAAALLFATALSAAEKQLMHCFVFTPIETASEADWQAFYKATDLLPSKIPVVRGVWYGKLSRPMNVFSTDGETAKKLAAADKAKKPGDPDPKATGEVTRVVRRHGVCMAMADQAALKTYADHPYHKEWEAAYDKVRVPHTTTFDMLPQ